MIAFSLAAFRQAYAAGRDLDSDDTAVIAGAACEIHPVALLKAVERRWVAESLARASAQAAARGVDSLPAIASVSSCSAASRAWCRPRGRWTGAR